MLKTLAGRAGTVAAATVLSGAALITAAGPAAAGTNGQQVSVSTRYSDQIRVCGYNQADSWVCTDLINSPNYWTSVGGWWWKGTVVIYGVQYDTPSRTHVTRAAQCYVPPSQSGDWTNCDVAGTL
ncbi:hypothetical protein ACFQ7J_25265 [Streptomyces sp. NPDC056501]|uniref:hypothetical protein n=1 Tax=Streptomyces sp. NPDC056501 TaxID=3345841 RepID=UPI0036BDAF35